MKIHLTTFLYAALLAGCSLLQPRTVVATVTVPAAFIVTPLPTRTPVPPTATTLPVSPACVPEVTNRPLEADTYGDYPRAILDYLNTAGSPVALTGLLNALGSGAQPFSVAVGDFTGDGRDDVAVALADSTAADPNGRLLVYACSLAGYELVLNLPAGAEFSMGFHIWFWQDLNADGSSELAVSRGFCGAHTCFEDLTVLGWDGAALVNLLNGSTSELPYPSVRVGDPDGDGLFDIEVSSGGFGSVGAGPQRPVTWIWTFDRPEGAWNLAVRRPEPSPYRIHVLHDADDAVAMADFDLAAQLYRRVIDDPTLDDWVVEDGAEVLAAYARYRLAVMAIALQSAAGAEAALAEMQAQYPPEDPLHDFVEMAILFRNAFASGGLGAACTGAAGFAEAHHETVLLPLGSSVYGYANRDYTGESMCPAPEID